MSDEVAMIRRAKAAAMEARTQYDRAAGALTGALASLSRDYGVDDLPAAEALLVRLEATAADARADYEIALAAYMAGSPHD